MSAQLALNLRIKDSASFANYYAARNAEALDFLHRALNALIAGKPSERVIFLWGGTGSGRTHLLQAACHQAQQASQEFAYVPLSDAKDLAPGILAELESTSIVCLDDIDVIAGQRAWEEAVFALIERLRARDALLIVAASAAPTAIGITLPDLVTRLTWGPIYPLHSLNDEEKLAALQLRANRLGLELPPDVARYVMARYPRDTVSLFAWLDRVDRDSFASQRRLTVPYVRDLERRESKA